MAELREIVNENRIIRTKLIFYLLDQHVIDNNHVGLLQIAKGNSITQSEYLKAIDFLEMEGLVVNQTERVSLTHSGLKLGESLVFNRSYSTTHFSSLDEAIL